MCGALVHTNDDIRITPLWILDDAHQDGVGFQSKSRLTHECDLFPEFPK